LVNNSFVGSSSNNATGFLPADATTTILLTDSKTHVRVLEKLDWATCRPHGKNQYWGWGATASMRYHLLSLSI